MIANDGTMGSHAGEDGTRIIGNITVDCNITNTNLQDQLNLKAPLNNPSKRR